MPETPFIELLRQRRSIRKFRPDRLPSATLERLQEAVLRAPTSRGRNPWHFLFVEDPELIARISQAKQHGSAFLAGAPLAVVVCADPQVSDVWIEDCAIAAITLQYAAHDLGLGSCWAQIRQREHSDQQSSEQYLRQLLGLDAAQNVLCVIGIGIADEEKPGHSELPGGKVKRLA